MVRVVCVRSVDVVGGLSWVKFGNREFGVMEGGAREGGFVDVLVFFGGGGSEETGGYTAHLQPLTYNKR